MELPRRQRRADHRHHRRREARVSRRTASSSSMPPSAGPRSADDDHARRKDQGAAGGQAATCANRTGVRPHAEPVHEAMISGSFEQTMSNIGATMRSAHPYAALDRRAGGAALIAGCSSGTKLDDARRSSRAPVERGAGARRWRRRRRPAAAARPVDRRGRARGAAPRAAQAALAGLARIIYFDYDSYTIKPEFQSLIDGHARFLKANRSRRIVDRRPHRRARRPRVQPGARPEALRGRAPRARPAGRDRRPGRSRELRQGKAGGAGRREAGVGAEPPRRDRLPLMSRAMHRAAGRCAAALAAAALLARRRRRAPRCSRTTRRAAPSSTCASASRRSSRPQAARPTSGADRRERPAAAQPARPAKARSSRCAASSAHCAAGTSSWRAR